MLISDMLKDSKPLLSLEIFPPKKDDGFEAISKTVEVLAQENPAYISVTCGAGGKGNITDTNRVAALVKASGAEPLAHLTCINASKDAIGNTLLQFARDGVQNILALRGDISREDKIVCSDFSYAKDLISLIASTGGFCIGAAAYPEGHVSCDDAKADIEHMLAKQEAGASFFITQLFFDNDFFFRFIDRAHAGGINLPIIPGVMPIMSRSQIERMIFLAGASLPSPIIKLLYRYENDPASLREAGLEHAIRQMEDLLRQGAKGVHIYTMNRPSVAKQALSRLRSCL